MSYQDELRAALARYDEARDARKALEGQEGDEARAQAVELDTKLDDLTNEVRGLQAKAENEKAVEEARSALPTFTPRFKTEARGNTDEDVLRSVLNGEKRGHVFEAETRALNAGTSSNYANGTFAERVLGAVEDKTAVLKAGAFILSTGDGNEISAPTMDSFAPVKTAEGSALPDTATSTPRNLTAYTYGGVVRVNNNLVDDVNGPVLDVVARKGAQLVRNELAKALLLGDGSGDPQGAVVGSTLGANAAAASVTVADIYELFYSVQSDNTAWIMNGTTAAAVRTATDSTNLWTESPALDQPGLLLGKPVYIDANMADIGASAKSIIFGDFNEGYTARIVRGVQVAATDARYFEYNETGVRVLVRADGLVTDGALIKHLLHAAS